MIILESILTTFEARIVFWEVAGALSNIGSSQKPYQLGQVQQVKLSEIRENLYLQA
jgi:hypothetical protein